MIGVYLLINVLYCCSLFYLKRILGIAQRTERDVGKRNAPQSKTTADETIIRVVSDVIYPKRVLDN